MANARFGRNVAWSSVSVFVIAGSQIILMSIMARLLTPADFGLMAMAGISLRFATYFAQLGVVPAIIQKKELTSNDIGAGFSVSVVLGTLFMAGAITAAPIAEWFFEMQRLSLAIQVLSVGFLMTSVGAVAGALLRRELNFKALAIIEIVAYIGGYGVAGVVAALYGFGVWALIIASLSQGALTTIGSIVVAGTRAFQLRHDSKSRRHFLAFGSKYSLIGFIEFLSFNVDSILIGKLTAQAQVGQYNRAMLLANLPVQQPVGIITKVLLPSMAQWQSDTGKFKTALQAAFLAVGSYAFIASGIISITATGIVNILLGPQWGAAIDVLGILALAAGPYCISNVSGVTMDAQAWLKPKLRIQASMLLFLIALIFVLATKYGVKGAAAAIVIIEWMRMIVYLTFFHKKKLVDLHFIVIAICLPILVMLITLTGVDYLITKVFSKSSIGFILSAILSVILISILILIINRKAIFQLPAAGLLASRIPGFKKLLP